MNGKNRNNFEIVHKELIEFCEECTLSKKANCSKYDEKCTEYSNRYDDLYYSTLYPFHPCKKCPAIGNCGSSKPGECNAYWHFCRMRLIAECEIKNNVVFFSREKIQMVCGPADLITEEYLKSNSFFRKAVDFRVTADYIAEIKREPIYSELLSTVRQYLEYCLIHEQDSDETEFVEEFYRI